MSDEQNEISVFETRRFEKALNKLSEKQLSVVEDEIDKINDNRELGVQKKGDLSHLRVHKFKSDNQQVLLGYSCVNNELSLYLLNLGSHANFYQEMKRTRIADLNVIK